MEEKIDMPTLYEQLAAPMLDPYEQKIKELQAGLPDLTSTPTPAQAQPVQPPTTGGINSFLQALLAGEMNKPPPGAMQRFFQGGLLGEGGVFGPPLEGPMEKFRRGLLAEAGKQSLIGTRELEKQQQQQTWEEKRLFPQQAALKGISDPAALDQAKAAIEQLGKKK